MHSLYEVTKASKIFLVTDCYTSGPSANGHLSSTYSGDPGPPYVSPRHQKVGLNFIFVDGHGEFVKDNPVTGLRYFATDPSDTWPSYKDNGSIWSN